MIAANEHRKLLAVPLCGERVIERLDSIGVRRLSDLRGRDPWQLMHNVNLRAGRVIWRAPMATLALQNLIDSAERELPTPTAALPNAKRTEG